MKYYLIAGEASGDFHASRLMRELREQDSEAQFRFYGGDAMAAEGGTLVRHYRDLAYMGFYQVVTHLGTILSGMKNCKADIAAFAPDVVILVDYPGFNLGIAKWVKEHLSAQVVYYISPKIWAWKEYRISQIRKYVDLMLSIFPFEVDWYARRDYQVAYVGNPTVDELFPLKSNREQHRYKSSEPYLLLVPGSRKAEVTDNLNIMLRATDAFGLKRIIAGAPGLDASFYAEVLKKLDNDAEVFFGQTHALMLGAQAAAVTSGTASLEAAYLGCPQVVCYNFKGGKLVYNIMKRVLKSIRYVSLPNLVLYGLNPDEQCPDERHAFVPELLGPYLSPETLRQNLSSLIDEHSYERHSMLANYNRMVDLLGEPGAPKRAAKLIIDRNKVKNK
ncbi:MAG: lipid-A-disaccharide synthase [Bacteroidales bacterium]|nr:lipid-A-disaccharide synthase [Bacteroidales bacterium]